VVVESASAMQLAGENFYKLDDCNHLEVCKPPNRRHPSYSMLLNVLRLCSKGLDAPKSGREVLEPATTRQVLEQAATARQKCSKNYREHKTPTQQW